MKLIIQRQSLSRILRWTQRALLTGAVALLAYCVFVWLDAETFQRSQRSRLLTNLAAGQKVIPAKTAPPAMPEGLIGRLDIERLGVSVIVMEGTDAATLRRAVGHVAGTALPGQKGNVGLSGHRDTFFRPLRNVRSDDIIMLTTITGQYRYRVVSTRIVTPYTVAVLDPTKTEVLTLVTCYPFYYIGAAPQRFIVRAERVV